MIDGYMRHTTVGIDPSKLDAFIVAEFGGQFGGQ